MFIGGVLSFKDNVCERYYKENLWSYRGGF